MTNKEKIQGMSTRELTFLLCYLNTCEHCIYTEEDCVKKAKEHIFRCEEGVSKWLELESDTTTIPTILPEQKQ